IIPPKHKRKPMAILECGNINYIAKFAKNIEEPLYIWPNAHLSKDSITKLLQNAGMDYGSQRKFFKSLATNEK
ncbi:MAG: hypothetical protein QXJ27_08180, partial [Thermoplasmata archaeon]